MQIELPVVEEKVQGSLVVAKVKSAEHRDMVQIQFAGKFAFAVFNSGFWKA